MAISTKFYEQLLRQYFFAKKLQSQTVIRENHCKKLLYKKRSRKMLMKLTLGRHWRLRSMSTEKYI